MKQKIILILAASALFAWAYFSPGTAFATLFCFAAVEYIVKSMEG